MKLTANRASGPYVLHGQERGIGAKLLRVMKLTTIVMLAFCLHTNAKGVAQQTITFSGKEVSLENVFNAIKKQTSYRFFFNTDAIPRTTKVTIDVKNASIDQVMHLALKDQPLTFAIKGRTIFIMKKAETKTSFVEEQQPPIDVKGRVVNENGEPVEGVNVTLKGTNNVASSNFNGEFIIKGVDENGTLVFTSVNMETFELKVKGKSFLDVALQTKVTSMQEIVINKGYYTEKRMLSTGNVSTVKARDLEKQPVNNPLLALQGRVPGLFIEQATGFANSGIKVRIQGLSSISSGVDPLYVIDGVPYTSQTLPTIQSADILGTSGATPLPSGAGNPLSFINPNDIESIDVLKDADATAIYGSRGANGVILITTKKGKVGPTKVNINLRSGYGKVGRKIQLLNTEQYLEMRREAKINDNASILTTDYDINGTWDQSRYTDWQKVLVGGTAKYSDAQLSITGGNSNTQFLLGCGYHKETTVFPGDFSDRKSSLQFNVHHTNTNQKLDVQFSGTYVTDNNEVPVTDLTLYAMLLPPNAPELYNEDGSLNWSSVVSGTGKVSTWTNPLSYLENRYNNKVNNLISNAVVGYKILSGLTLKTNFGYTNLQTKEVSTTSLLSNRPELRPTRSRSANYANGNINSWIVEPQITYQAGITKGKLDVMIGSSFQQNNTNREQLLGTGHSSDLVLKDIRAASSVTVRSSLSSLYKYNALFGRVNYNLDNQFIINLTARRDGSSRFGSENLFSNFWGAAMAWIFSKSPFASHHLPWLSFGKVRASFGTSGNDQIGDYGFMNLYNPVTNIGVAYQNIPSISPDKHTNPYLQWEETKKLQFGLDLGFINDRILLNLNYYYNRSSNLLTSNNLSIVTGFPSINQNFQGVVQNSGWEITINTINIKTRNFNWTTNINLTIPNNKLVSFPNLGSSVLANSYAIGKSLYDLKSYHFLGVDPATGLYQLEDRFGNPTYLPSINDLTTFINTSPKIYGGLQNNIQFKGVELDWLLQFVSKDGNPYLLGNRPGAFTGTFNNGNQPVSVLQRWKKSGDITNIQRFSTSYPTDVDNTYSNTTGYSDAVIGDASYLKLTNLSLSWQLPIKWAKAVKLQHAKLFIQGQNLFTVTRFVGIDPALGSSYVLPPLRLITIGAQVSL